jgi:hypothetical protein
MSSSSLGTIVLKHDPSVSSGFSCVYKSPEEMTTRAAEKMRKDADQTEMILDDPADEERDQAVAGPSTGWGSQPGRGSGRGSRGGRGGRVAQGGRGAGGGRGNSSAGRGSERGAIDTEEGGTGGTIAGTGPREADTTTPKGNRSKGATRDKQTGRAGLSQTEQDEGGKSGNGEGALGAEEEAESGDSDQPLLTFGGGLPAAKKARRKSDKSGQGQGAKKGKPAGKGDGGKGAAKRRGGAKAGGASEQEKGGGEDVQPKKKRPRKKKESARATEEAKEEENEEQLVEDLAQTRKKLAELAQKKGKKKVGSTAQETGGTDEVEQTDVEIDPVGTRVGGVLTKQGKNMSYTTAAKMLKKIANNITNTTLERQITEESIFKSCSSMGMVKIPVGYCVTGPLKVKGKVWNVNLRTINEEGVESLIKMFCAEGYSEFAPGMLEVVEVSGQSQYRGGKCVMCMSKVMGWVFLYSFCCLYFKMAI